MKILVYGWYHQGNLGDDLFMEAYRNLFPDYDFVFTDNINVVQLEGVDAVFFGGGSFLLESPKITDDALRILKGKKILYLGIGVEAKIHPIHLELMSQAKIIATRSPEQIIYLQSINKNSFYVPDLVYSLQSKVQLSPKSNRSVLIMPNINVVPQRLDPHWKHAAWAYFKSEFTQFMDWLVENEYQPTLFSMCNGVEVDDNWASAELVSHMDNRSRYYIRPFLYHPSDLSSMTQLLSKYDLLITQRFHGIVLAEMTRTPYIAIHHHDKLKNVTPGDGTFLSYYNSSKQSFINAFEQTINMKFVNSVPINSHLFGELIEVVNENMRKT